MTATMTPPATASKTIRRTPEPTSTALNADRIVAQLRLIADPTRLSILTTLESGERSVSALCEAAGQTQPATSHHLSLLRVSGIVATERRGKNIFYALSPLGRRCLKAARAMSD